MELNILKYRMFHGLELERNKSRFSDPGNGRFHVIHRDFCCT